MIYLPLQEALEIGQASLTADPGRTGQEAAAAPFQHASTQGLRGLFVAGALAFTMLAVGGVFAVLLLRSVLSPIRQLADSARRFAEGDLSHHTGRSGGDEVGNLAREFDSMANNLERSWSALEDMSNRDGLTGLYNRRAFHERLDEELARCRRHGHAVSLLMLDIDGFKAVNDSHGHQAGDSVLFTVAAQIGEQLRTTDLLARYGGEEFTVILPETGVDGAVTIAERIRAAIASAATEFRIGVELAATVSIGAASHPADAESADELIGAADQALYAAKRAGRNRVARYQAGAAS